MPKQTKTILIGGRAIGKARPSFIIAQSGVNHNGDLNRALRLAEMAKAAGADCVKFQTFRAEDLVTSRAPKAAYQDRNTNPRESQLRMLKKLELSYDAFGQIHQYCHKIDIAFLSTPYGFKDVDFLDSLNVDAYKIASGQLTEPIFLKYVAKKGKPVLLSTGMGTLGEVSKGVQAIFSTGNHRLIVLQCTTNYPSRIEDANLRVLSTFERRWNVAVGYSDHTAGPWAAAASVALGACVVEKHFTLDKSLSGPDHTTSLDPKEFKEFVKAIRQVETALGSSEKFPTEEERGNAKAMRRSLTTTRYLPKGTKLTATMITLKRPFTGLPASSWNFVLGKRLVKNLPPDTTITAGCIENGRRL